MVFCKRNHQVYQLCVEDVTIKQVQKCNYLSCVVPVTENVIQKFKGIKDPFQKLIKVLSYAKMSSGTKKRVLTCYEISIRQNGSECWTFSLQMKFSVHGSTDRCWEYHGLNNVIKKEVLRKTETERTFILKIRQKELKFMRYIMRKDGFENLTLKGFIEGKRKQWVTYLTGLCEWMAEKRHRVMVMSKILLRFTRDRKLWRSMITYWREVVHKKRMMNQNTDFWK